jgi:hypothetical protein
MICTKIKSKLFAMTSKMIGEDPEASGDSPSIITASWSLLIGVKRTL